MRFTSEFKKKSYAVTLSIIILSIGVFIISIIAGYTAYRLIQAGERGVKNEFSKLALWEQEDKQQKILEKIGNIENQVNVLEEAITQTKDKKSISLDDKRTFMEKTDNLEKEAEMLRIINDDYQNNLSIQLNPYHDKSIDDFFNKTLFVPVEIKRLNRSLEFSIFRGFITDEQWEITQKNFRNIRWQIDKVKNVP